MTFWSLIGFSPTQKAGAESPPDPSRRRILMGLGIAGCAAVAGPILFSDDAEAALAESPADAPAGGPEEDGSYETAQYYDDRRRRPHRRYRRPHRRYRRRRSAAWRCRNDPYYRRRHRNYCYRLTHRRRRPRRYNGY